ENDNQWTKIYETDKDGIVISGKLDDLKAAFRSAPDVRIYVPSWNRTFNIDSTNMDNMEENATFCSQSLFHVVKTAWDTFSETAIRMFYLFCSTGFYQKKEYRIGDNFHSYDSDDIGFVGMAWFTRHFCKPTGKYPIFSSNDQAQQFCSSLSKLLSAIHHGSEIRLGTAGLVLPVDQMTFNPSLAVAHSDRRLKTVIYHQSDGIEVRKLYENWIYYNYGSDGTRENHIWSVGTHFLVRINPRKQKFADFYSDACWSLVYSHANSGDVLQGTVRRLRASVLSGRRIRMIVNGNISGEPDSLFMESNGHVTNISGEPDSLFMESNGHVTAQLLSQLSVSNQSRFQFDPYTFWQMISSSGFANVMKMYIESNRTESSETFKFNVNWFADTRAWRKLLAVSNTGHVTKGSKNELSRSLKSGGMLRLLVTFPNGTINAFSPDSVEFYQEEVAAQFIRHVGHVKKSASNERIFPAVPFWNYLMVTTEGRLVSSLWIVGENAKVSDTSIMVKTVWFVN
ncbi:uncharacterized protein LOC117320908, partial [Pecten maximus]|uniref:uncharacterized protein LOC117320908 n=1 Tax=Pecten maximus TaxID=6579 RepID=UPI0014586DF6